VPAPVRTRMPVDENPVMLSRQVPLAAEQFVPPLATGTTVEAQETTVPRRVMLSWTAFGKVAENDGTLAPLVIRTEFAAAAVTPSGAVPAPNSTPLVVSVALPLPPLETDSGEVPGLVCASAESASARPSAIDVANMRSSLMRFSVCV
jgi:hypothetical protein